MLPRNVYLILAVAFGICIGAASAQPKTETKKEIKPAPTVEQRLAILEDQTTKMLAEIKAIRAQLKEGTAPARADMNNISIYRLKNLEAAQMAKLLQDLLNIRDNKSVRIVADTQTNSLLVAGKDEDQMTIRAIIARLDDDAVDPAPPKKEKR